jgi:fumarate reductase subunit C
MERRLFIAQRVTAILLGPLVFIHLGLILYAVRGGLTGIEILNRTQGNYLWASFYSIFVVAVAIHAPIGFRNILKEWTSFPSTVITGLSLLLGCTFLGLGLRAVVAIT